MKNVSLNFGAIKDTVYRLSAKQLVSESKISKEDNSLTKFINKIKEESTLRLQYMIFENLEKGHFENERLAERYINENMRLTNGVDWNDLLEVNKKVRKEILDENYVQAVHGKDSLYEAVHVLIESRTNLAFTSINKSHEAYENVLAHLQRDVSEVKREKEEKADMPNFFSWKYVNEHAISNFNKRYKHLNESDKELFKILVSSNDVKINYAKDLKNENLERISSLMEDSDSATLLEGFKSKLENISEINEKNVDDIIINCSELNINLSQL